jgi:hypothetical protein
MSWLKYVEMKTEYFGMQCSRLDVRVEIYVPQDRTSCAVSFLRRRPGLLLRWPLVSMMVRVLNKPGTLDSTGLGYVNSVIYVKVP